MNTTVYKLIQWITGILLVISTAFQLLALLAGVLLNDNGGFAKQEWLIPAWIAALTLLVGSYVLALTVYQKKWPLVWIVTALVGAVLALIVALALKDICAPYLGPDGRTVGLTTWRLCYRHYSSVAVGVLTAIGALMRLSENVDAKRAYDRGEHMGAGSTLDFDLPTEDAPARKQKRSVRRAAEKAQEKQEFPTE